MQWFEVFILSLVEGLTEYLPVSSTGHLILTANFFGIQEEGFVKAFNIIIQFGAIAAVLVVYWRRFLPNLVFYKKITIAFLPAAVIGLAVKHKIDLILGSSYIVAIALIIGGVVLLFTDKLGKQNKTIQDLNYLECLSLGLIQCLAFIPGVSRAGATILGGLYLGLNRKEATEFSFFLAVPTLTGAAMVKAIGARSYLSSDHATMLIAGIILSFLFALLAIRFFIHLVSKGGFKYFGYYRIILGIVVLILMQR